MRSRNHAPTSVIRTAAFLAAVVMLAGCSRGASTPQDGMRSYRDALESGNQELAWDQMSPEYQARTSDARFGAEFERRMEEGDPLIDELDEATDANASLGASLAYSRHESVELGFIDGEWRITSGVANFYDRSTPQLALVAFIHAVENHDVNELLRLVPSTYRSQMSAGDLERWLDDESEALTDTIVLLRANADAPITETDGTAVLRYGAEEMRFLQEGLDWTIEDF